MKIRLKALLFISAFVLLYATYYWVVPVVVNISGRVPLIKSYVKKETGMDIELKNPTLKMGLTPSIWIDAKYFAITDKKNSPLTVSNPKLKVALLPLFRGKVHLTYFSCDKINADLKFDKKLRFYIGDYLIVKKADSEFSIEDSTMDVENYQIKINDELQKKNIFLNGEYFCLEKYNSKKHVKFSTNSKINIDKRLSVINADVDFKLPLKKIFDSNEIVFDGAITNLDLGDFSPYIKRISKNNIQNIDGILNIEADTKKINLIKNRIKTKMVIENFSLIEKNNPLPIRFKNKLNINSLCDFSKNSLEIKNFEVHSGTINLDLSGKINKISSKTPILDLSVLINKSRIEDFIALLPNANSKNLDLNIVALKKYGYYSDLEGKLHIKGKASAPDIKGKCVSSNGHLGNSLPAYVPKISVKLNFLGKNLFMDIEVPVEKTDKIFVKGNSDLYGNQKATIDVISTANFDLKRTESILNPLQDIFSYYIGPLPVLKLQGLGNINIKIKGSKTDPHVFGEFNFKNTTAQIKGISMILKNSEGTLYFKDKNTLFVTKKSSLGGKQVKLNGTCTLGGDLDYIITANGQELENLLYILKKSPLLLSIQKRTPAIKSANGNLNITIKLKGKIKSINDFAIGKTVHASGNIKLLGNNILFSNLQIPFKNLFGNIEFKGSDADFNLYSQIDKSNKVIIKGKIKNGILNSKIKLDDMAFLYSKIPVKIYSGNLEINNNKLTLYKINTALDAMPVLLDGTITNIFNNPEFDIYINSKPTQRFIDKYINKNSTYPLKIKGDIIYSTRVNGTKEAFSTNTEVNLQEDSNIYYMGSTIGDLNDPIRIYLDTNVSLAAKKHLIQVNNFQYDKLISSQNDKEFVAPQLVAKGQIDISNNDIKLNNFRVKTLNPTDAKIFNILFKKPLIKQGLFSSNVIINDSISSPKLIGFLNFNGIDIPLLDTTIKDISLDFGNNNIDIKSKGEVFANKIILFANMENRLTPPYIFNDIDIYLGNLDVNEIAKSLNRLEIEADTRKLAEQKQDIDITNLIIKKAKLKADSVFVKNIFAKNLTANFSLDEKLIFLLDDFKFEVAEGNVNGDFKYNLLNSKSELMLNVDKVNANSMTEALFDLPNQVYGSLTGKVDLTCNGKSHKTCMDTLVGNGGFRIADGKMPKLGSLEYLLKAANLVKSGITGITINSIIELVTPLKTGQFETINGSFTIESGLANSIQIFSKGKDLSIFLTGTYNFSTLVADMEVFGRVSKRISNVLGVIGNTSLNTLFNTIPGLNLDESNKADFIKNLNKIPGFEFNDKTYRIFSSEIYGDINGENYVKSFKWIE